MGQELPKPPQMIRRTPENSHPWPLDRSSRTSAVWPLGEKPVWDER
jgi:hypothetical protein